MSRCLIWLNAGKYRVWLDLETGLPTDDIMQKPRDIQSHQAVAESENAEATKGVNTATHLWHLAMCRALERSHPGHGDEIFRKIRASTALDNLKHSRLVVKLNKMAITRELSSEIAHKALVRCLQFSPDGRFLATAR